eukprot:4708927-Amphidinium_carterae.1
MSFKFVVLALPLVQMNLVVAGLWRCEVSLSSLLGEVTLHVNFDGRVSMGCADVSAGSTHQ